ncbi:MULTISPECIES: cache domain-containing sensor histidine kinase [unclassified Ruminococcus]|uniref:cache domain-containing sensor histidine kinase n=1 Tax=unclassified Ruminococcus TaxID=2608920 RepID=UPI0018AB854C|nr:MULTISPECIES: sensor histidine kinase [unclassified Ruminococcus]MDB8774204.1 histidine kinase [Ruminococcus sp. 1001136sp1]
MEKKYHFQGFRKFSIKTRLVIALLMISIIPLVGISGYSFHIFSAALQEKLSASISQTLSMINLNMVSEIEKYQYLCGSICISEEIKKGLLKKDMTDMEKNQAILEIQSMIRNKIIYPAQAKNITVYDTDGNIFYDLGYDGFYQKDVDRILSQLEEQDQDVWAYAHTYRDRNILVLGRRIYEHYSKSRVIGYTLISIEEKIFSKTVLEPVGLSDSSNIMYMNLDGTVLSSWNRSIALGEKTDEELLKKIQERLPKKTDSFSIHENGEEQLVTYIFNKNLNQLFVYTMPYHYINSEVYAMLKQILVVVMFLVLLCIGIVAMVYQGIMSPIKRMLEFCREVSEGKLSVRIQDKHKDELSRLSGSMDHMADTIEHLMDQQKTQEKKKRELELQMLQYQLNPHFLFNTLNSLRFVAAMHKDQIVSDGIQALSSLLQNTLTNKNEYITIQEELENLENYFSILRIRYAGSFEYSFHVEEDELLSCLVPKLILQPLAENSVMHGSSDNGTVMEIQITCWRENKDVMIELSDDGKGFEVTDDALAPHPERKRIGVANVNDRIQLNFGRKYGLKINSQPGKGTTCTLTLPELYADTLS